MTIPRRKTTPADPDHVLDAEFALDPYFQELAEKAKAAARAAAPQTDGDDDLFETDSSTPARKGKRK